MADAADPATLGVPMSRWLDTMVFTSPTRPWRDVMVAGRWVIRDHEHAQGKQIARDFTQAMADLWRDA